MAEEMPMSQNDSLIQDAVNNLREHLEEMPQNMRLFSMVFRALYSDQAVGGHSEAAVKFRKIRDDTRQDAMVYLKCILPATTNFISSVKEYFGYYEALSYEEWREMLPDILEETRTHKDLAQTVLDMHQDIMIPLKTRQDRARVVMAEFVNLQSVYHLSEGSPRENIALSIASEKQYEINKTAARIMAETLIPALSRFIDGLQKVARFFQVIEKELELFEEGDERGMDERKKLHYKFIRNSAKEMKSLCHAFYRVLPDIRTDFEALPSEDTDQNYVDKWLKKMLADIGSPSKFKALLGTSSVNGTNDTDGNLNPAPTPENNPASPPENNLASTLKNNSEVTPKYNSAPTLEINPAPTLKNYPAPKLKNNPAQTLKYNPATTLGYNPAQTLKNNPAPTLKNNPASTPENNIASTLKNNPAPTLKNNPAPTLKNNSASTPENNIALTLEDIRISTLEINRPPTPVNDPVTEIKRRLKCCNIL